VYVVSYLSCAVTVQLVRPLPAGISGSAMSELPSNSWKRCASATEVACVAVAFPTDSVTGIVFCGPSSVVEPDAGDGLLGVFALSVGMPSGTAATPVTPPAALGETGELLLLQAALAASSPRSVQ
jgi:hypothetical protein